MRDRPKRGDFQQLILRANWTRALAQRAGPGGLAGAPGEGGLLVRTRARAIASTLVIAISQCAARALDLSKRPLRFPEISTYN